MLCPLRLVVSTTVACLSAVVVIGAQSPVPTAKAESFAQAARSGDAATVAKLLDRGMDVNTKFRYGATALSFACDHGQLEVVKVLLARGADVNVKDTFYGATPLTWASSPAMKRKPEHADIVGLLLKHGAAGKESALLSAISEGDAAMTKVILDDGPLGPDTLADALESATNDKRPDIVALLERAGAKPRPEFKMDDAQLARYAGTYRSAAGTELMIAVDAGHLAVRAGRSDPAPRTLVARSETTFAIRGVAAVTFTFRIENDKVTAFSLANPGGTTLYSRTGSE